MFRNAGVRTENNTTITCHDFLFQDRCCFGDNSPEIIAVCYVGNKTFRENFRDIAFQELNFSQKTFLVEAHKLLCYSILFDFFYNKSDVRGCNRVFRCRNRTSNELAFHVVITTSIQNRWDSVCTHRVDQLTEFALCCVVSTSFTAICEAVVLECNMVVVITGRSSPFF